MDKMRAIEYFLRAAELGSFSAAARALAVSTPAVTTLVAALERTYGARLFNRSSRGLTLTTDGEQYLEAARDAMASLAAAEQRIGGARGAGLRGALTVGVRRGIGHHFLAALVPTFLARHPQVELNIRPVTTFDEMSAQALDLTLMAGWTSAAPGHLVAKRLAPTRLVVCAAPAYWRQVGMPAEPEALRAHHCLVIRSSGGTLVDRWMFERGHEGSGKEGGGQERRSVDVRTRLYCDDEAWLVQAARAGAGVLRIIDLAVGRYLQSGELVPVLQSWACLEAPELFAIYPAAQRRSALQRAFLEFFVEALEQASRPEAGLRFPAPAPAWYGRTRGRQSVFRG